MYALVYIYVQKVPICFGYYKPGEIKIYIVVCFENQKKISLAQRLGRS